MYSEDPRIDKFVDNEMSEQERIQFIQEMELNNDLKKSVLFKQFIIEGIQSEGEEELKEYIRTRVQDESEESQTNLWLYAVATVTVVLVSYFVIVQYIKTGSLKEATEILALNHQPSAKHKSKRNVTSNYKAPTIYADSIAIYNDSTNLLTNNDGNGYAITDEISASENDIEEVAADKSIDNLSTEKSAAIPLAQPKSNSNNWSLSNDNSHIVRNIVLVPIKLDGSLTSNWDDQTSTIENSTKKAKLKVMKEPSKKEDKDIAKAADTLVNEVSKVRNAVSISKINLIFTDNKLPKQAIETNSSKGIFTIILSNFSSDNPLVYQLNNKYYLELGPKTIYAIPVVSSKVENPKPITDKAILKAIQN